MLTPARQAQLDRLHEEGQAIDTRETIRAHKRLNVDPDIGRLLAMLAWFGRVGRVLEIGTSNGVSSIWLAAALEDVGGRLFSIDVNPDKTNAARTNLAQAGLLELATLLTGDAAEVLAASAPDAYDLIFLDADRSRYGDYWPDLRRVLRSRGLIVVDNALSHAEECQPFFDLVAATPGYRTLCLPLGKGGMLILKN
ncbi:O-methyltransferase [Chitinimonas lacunae]|uniref:O-methyltransferase n=1 Tax=Chitinimonas lacunae TaxID=1963018 RepID=A0ABV8MN65_9NEIS